MNSQYAPRHRLRILALLIALMAALLTGGGYANAQKAFTMIDSTIDGGGGASTGGSFSLGATIAQPDAGQMRAGSFTILGGFWTPQGLELTGVLPGNFRLRIPFVVHEPAEAK